MPRFVAYDRQESSRLPAQNMNGHRYGSVWLGNQNQNFLTTVPGALVAKNGFTDAASHTYLCAAERHGRRLGVIFLRAQRYPLDQWQQAAALLDWGYALPRGVAVGHLDAPPATQNTASPSVDRPATSAAQPPSAKRQGSGAPSSTLIVIHRRRCRRGGDLGRRPATDGPPH